MVLGRREKREREKREWEKREGEKRDGARAEAGWGAALDVLWSLSVRLS